MMVYDDIDLTQRVFATAFGVQVVFNQLNVVASDAVNRLIDGVDRAVAVRRLGLDLFTTGQLHGSGGDIAGAGLHAEVIQTEMLWFFLLFINKRQRFRVIVEHRLFLSASFRNASYRWSML